MPGLQAANQTVKKLDITEVLGLAGSRMKFQVISAATKTLTYDECGQIFYMTYAGATTVTLPANTYAVKGRWFLFINTVDQAHVYAAATADSLIADGDLEADSVTFSTSSHKAGSMLLIIGTGSKWAAINMSVGCTMTVNT